MRSFVIGIFLVMFGAVVPLFLLEGGLRLKQRIKDGVPLLRNPSYRWDAALGWRGTEHRLGERASARPVLVLGDSFTEGMGVPSEKMWFSSLRGALPDSSIVAYGGLGYGSLQELMVLEEYLAGGLAPSLVVVQLCSNDIINNSFALERESVLQRAPAPRPYREGRRTEVRLPRSYDWVLTPLIAYSRFAYRYQTKWEERVAASAREHRINSVEFDIQRQGLRFQPFADAVDVTESLLHRMKRRAGAPLVFLLADDVEPYTSAFRMIAEKHGVPLVIPLRGDPMPESGRMPDGTHLNEEGNAILGERFVSAALRRGVLPLSY